ncbi:MAG: SdrD B-like domain-containing protein, partial [Bacteroidota bacterium]
TTDANGFYTIGNIVPGSYKITFGVTPGGYTPTTVDKGGNDATDSDYGVSGQTPVLKMVSADTILTFDAGYWLSTRIGSLVWDDINGNGLQDADEPGISGVSVILNGTEGDGDIVNLSTTTSATGEYAFGDQSSGSSNLAPGTYNLTFVLPVGGYVPTRSNDTDGTDANDSDADEATGATAFEILTSGENNPTYDAGYYLPPSIGNYAWNDSNANGIQEVDELPLEGVSVVLTGIDGQGVAVSASKTTDANGYYTFNNLVPGIYHLNFAPPSGYALTGHDLGGDDTKDNDANDSDADEATGATAFEVLTSGENNPTYDAGFYLPPSIGNYAWNDSNANGIQEVDELPLEGVSVVLTGVDGQGVAVSASKTTDANGYYTFNNLVPGVYHLNFAPPSGYALTGHDLGGDDTKDNDANESLSGRTVDETLVSGEYNTTYDAGFYAAVSVGNLV